MGEKPPEEEKPVELYPIMGLAQKRTQVRSLATISREILYHRYLFRILEIFLDVCLNVGDFRSNPKTIVNCKGEEVKKRAA